MQQDISLANATTTAKPDWLNLNQSKASMLMPSPDWLEMNQ
jgi:CelD/BcsL family acetyltransferase involved in cellulose biosynthesis